MRKSIFTAFFCLFILNSFGQKLESYLTVSPIMTFGSNHNSDSQIGFGFSSSFQEYYNVTDKFAIGTELKYTYGQFNLIANYSGIKIPESTIYYKSSLTIQTLNIPIQFKFSTSNKWTLQVGFGVTYVLNSKSKVNYIYNNGYDESDIKKAINEKDDNLGKDYNGYINLSFGKSLNILKHKAFIQAYYELAIDKYDFNHSGYIEEKIYHYGVKPQQVGIKIGFSLF